MRDIRRGPGPGLVVLGACTLWLVVQNTLLLLALLWTGPRRARRGGDAHERHDEA